MATKKKVYVRITPTEKKKLINKIKSLLKADPKITNATIKAKCKRNVSEQWIWAARESVGVPNDRSKRTQTTQGEMDNALKSLSPSSIDSDIHKMLTVIHLAMQGKYKTIEIRDDGTFEFSAVQKGKLK